MQQLTSSSHRHNARMSPVRVNGITSKLCYKYTTGQGNSQQAEDNTVVSCMTYTDARKSNHGRNTHLSAARLTEAASCPKHATMNI